MKLLAELANPLAVLVVRVPTTASPNWVDFQSAGKTILEALQIELDGERVAIKPNVTSGERFADPDNGICTHPGFVQGMVEYLAQHGAQPRRMAVIEDPRNSDDNQPRHWLGTGYDRLAAETGIQLRCPTAFTCVKKKVPKPQVFERLSVSRLAVAPGTVLFNVPKLKTHNLSITTLGMKNLMGLVNVFDRHYCAQAWKELPEPARSETRPRQEWMTPEIHRLWQEGLARRLVDTAQVIQPALTIVEGVVGREGTGFQRGRNRSLGLVIAGTNIVAVDSVASYLMGFDPLNLPYLSLAAEAGLGVHDVQKLKIYTWEKGELHANPDIQALRAQPAFRVVTWTQGEIAVEFSDPSSPIPDASGVVLTNIKFSKE